MGRARAFRFSRLTGSGSAGSTGGMARNAVRTDWTSVVLDMAIETSCMQVLNRRGGFRKIPYARVIFRTASGTTFSGPRISAKLRRALERGLVSGPRARARRV